MTADWQRARLAAVATGLPQLVFGCRVNGDRTWPGPQWIVFTGLSAAQSVGFGWLEAIHPEDRVATLARWEAAGTAGEVLVEHRIRRARDEAWRWHQTRAVPLPVPVLEPDSTEIEWVGSSVDVDDVVRLREQIAVAELRLRTLLEGVPLLLWRSCDLGRWTWASPRWLDHTGQTQEQSHGRGWLEAVHPDDRDAASTAWELARANGELDLEFRVLCAADGTWPWHRTWSMPARDETGRIVEWLGSTANIQNLKDLQQRQQALLAELQFHARDLEAEIRERKRMEARLLHGALHDDLTQLRNRAFLLERLRGCLDGRSAAGCAVLFLDIDRFKLVNDSLGHQAGDGLLWEIAKRLQTCIGAGDTLARFGGDEFALLVEGPRALDKAIALAERIVAALERPFWLGAQEVFASCSIGIVQVTECGAGPEDVLRDADIAMYHAKRHGTGGYAVFTEAMRAAAVEALEWRTDLRNAVARSEFRLHYQPICDAATRAIVSVEALVRWQHPRRGLVGPNSFVGIAEEIGLIRPIGRWVLREAGQRVQAWRDRFPALELGLSVNVSAAELDDATFLDELRAALDASGLPPPALQLEVTESLFIRQPERVMDILDGIRRIGVRVALDDFGTGYSSLSYLDRYAVDSIKIDRSFVTGLSRRPGAGAIVASIVQLGRSLGREVVAEGVEEEAQLAALQRAGCRLVQGYLLGRPEPADAIEVALARQSRVAG